jgi:hypothetical protein
MTTADKRFTKAFNGLTRAVETARAKVAPGAPITLSDAECVAVYRRYVQSTRLIDDTLARVG